MRRLEKTFCTQSMQFVESAAMKPIASNDSSVPLVTSSLI
jgi:hypothetical protein